MSHGILIALHALSGVLALGAGAFAIRDGRFISLYVGALAGTTAFLVAAVAVSWPDTDTPARVLFTAFAVLAAVMVVRGLLARRGTPGTHAYVEHIGFTLVALFDAFVVITVLNTGAPVYLVVASGVAIAVAGHFVLRVAHRELVAEEPRPRVPTAS
jgi:hypothetical protein